MQSLVPRGLAAAAALAWEAPRLPLPFWFAGAAAKMMAGPGGNVPGSCHFKQPVDLQSQGGDLQSLGGDLQSLGGDLQSVGGDLQSLGDVWANTFPPSSCRVALTAICSSKGDRVPWAGIPVNVPNELPRFRGRTPPGGRRFSPPSLPQRRNAARGPGLQLTYSGCVALMSPRMSYRCVFTAFTL